MSVQLSAAPDLGRGLIVLPDQAISSPFKQAPVFTINPSTLGAPDDMVDQLHTHWVNRRPIVIRLGVEPAALKAALDETDDRPPWRVGTSFLFSLQRLHFLVWNNNIDMRTGEPIWWWTKKAVAIGARECTDSTGDVVLPDGTTAFCDGGPLDLALDHAVIPYTAIEIGQLRLLNRKASNAELAPDQLEAVHHQSGPARVIAPAGSGKTRVLTERLRHLLANCNIAPNTVLAVAYNTRAAGELTERSNGLNTHIRTLNSLAFAIVNGTGGFLRSSLEQRSRDMLDERGVRNVLSRMVELPRKTNTDPLAAWIEALSTARLGLKSPDAVENGSGDLAGFANVFSRYRDHLNKNALLDFDEQIYRAIEILLQDPKARLVAQRQCRTLLVDEFQDLTPAHVLMLRLLASPSLNVFGVGDDDQVIYGYAGADPAYLVNFDKWFPGAAHHALEVNYRCPPAVVTAASNMLTRNSVRVAKNIRAAPNREFKVGALNIDRVKRADMAAKSLEIINKWTEAGGRATEVAVLARVNVALLPVQVLLTESGIDHTSPVNATLLERTGIRTALAYLRIASNPDRIQRSDITETVRRPSRKIARNVTDMMTKKSHTSLRDLRRLATSLSGNDSSRVAQYIEDIEAIVRTVEDGDTASALEIIRTEVGLGEAMDVLDGSRKEADRSTHGDDLTALASVAHLHPNVETFEAWLNDVLSRTKQNGGVELSTVHRVKGREWDRVIVYDASSGLMPHRLSTDRSEERRILHVAMTRGRRRITVLTDSTQVSPFLQEFTEPGEPEIIRFIAPDNNKKRDRKQPVDSRTEALITALKDWRKTTASEAKIPAYTVLWDAHLEEIAAAVPKSLRELGKCNGIGPTKLERWGDEILATVSAANALYSEQPL